MIIKTVVPKIKILLFLVKEDSIEVMKDFSVFFNLVSFSEESKFIKEGNNKKVIRGGSWKDVKYFLQVSSRDYEYADQPRSYIGFRTVHDYLGADMTANQMVNDNDRKRNNKKSSIK